MSRKRHRGPERNAGAFLAPDMLLPVPMSTLEDEIPNKERELDFDDAPEPPEPPGLVQRLLHRLQRREPPLA